MEFLSWNTNERYHPHDCYLRIRIKLCLLLKGSKSFIHIWSYSQLLPTDWTHKSCWPLKFQGMYVTMAMLHFICVIQISLVMGLGTRAQVLLTLADLYTDSKYNVIFTFPSIKPRFFWNWNDQSIGSFIWKLFGHWYTEVYLFDEYKSIELLRLLQGDYYVNKTKLQFQR